MILNPYIRAEGVWFFFSIWKMLDYMSQRKKRRVCGAMVQGGPYLDALMVGHKKIQVEIKAFGVNRHPQKNEWGTALDDRSVIVNRLGKEKKQHGWKCKTALLQNCKFFKPDSKSQIVFDLRRKGTCFLCMSTTKSKLNTVQR